ncbi:MAG TPA: nuclear transport factor 2 family protein [Gemmatimonadales bacterium]|nr:nuclear transport factor 2 family protein [Gemmatimonadales bacterium]
MGGPIAARRLAAGGTLLLACVAGCVSRTVKPREVTAVGGGTDEVQALVQLALTLDAAGDRHADTLYTADAMVVGNARVRLAAPRFAGITIGAGRVTISAANATIEGRLAWILVDYRWVNPAERRAEAGRATFICERRGDSWKIVHAHSSQPLPWEP